MFKGFVQFIKSKTFLKNLAIFIALFSIVCWAVLRWLASYTNHGETFAVPDFSGVKLAQLDDFVSGKHVNYMIIDSLYDPKAAKGVVVRQEPEPNALVKDNRTVYLYVTSLQPPRVSMPKLIDRSLRQATAMITSYGLKLGKLEYKVEECSNCILEQQVKGKAISPGTAIPKGTVIDLVVGKGLQQEEEVKVPCLLGLTKKEALLKLQELYLTLGTVTYENKKDSLKSKVFDQSPPCQNTNVGIGTTIDIFLTTNKNKLTHTTSELNKKKQDEDFD